MSQLTIKMADALYHKFDCYYADGDEYNIDDYEDIIKEVLKCLSLEHNDKIDEAVEIILKG